MCPSCLQNQRELNQLRRKIWIIQEVSRIKNELMILDPVTNFRSTVANQFYKKDLERIFGVPFHFIKDRYLNMLNERNQICHQYNYSSHDSVMPSYCSLALREQKRQELLERTQRRVRQASTKRDMYAGAQWSGDVSNGITTVPKTSTESTQTDEAELKKTQSYKNSQTNPELSSAESGTQTEVEPNVRMVDVSVDAEPRMNDASVFVRPSTTDRNVETKPQTLNSGVVARPQMVETGTQSWEVKVKAQIEDPFDDELNEQQQAKEALIEMFKIYSVLEKLDLHPLDLTGRQLSKYYVRSGAKLYTAKKRLVIVPKVDWSETYSSLQDVIIHDPRFISYLANQKQRASETFPEYNKPLVVWEKLIGSKRKRDNPSDGDEADRAKQRLEDSFLFDKSTSTQLDDDESKRKILWLIFKNQELLESNGLRKKITPVINGSAKLLPIDRDGYIWIDGNSVSVFGMQSDRVKPATTKRVNWQSTLRSFINMVNDRGIDLVFVGSKDAELATKEFKSGDGEAKHGVLNGADEGMDSTKSDADNEAKTILKAYYSKLQSDGINIAFRLKPVVETNQGAKLHKSYYFGQPTTNKPLNIKNSQHRQVSGEALRGLMETIQWMDTFNTLIQGFEDLEKYIHQNDDQVIKRNLDDNLKALNNVLKSTRIKEPDDREENPLQKLHDEPEAAYQKYGEAMKRYEAAKEAVKGNYSKTARSALKAATSAMKATNTLFQIRAKAYNDKKKELEGSGIKKKLTGRGLRGAGVAPLEGVVHRGRTYNLNEIQGLATPSAYIYRQLGSKYIRIPDLDAKTLVIVQPNRRKCGPKREISDQLQAMVRTLAFKQHIDQASYDKLGIDDKKLFKEILAITHLQYNFHDRLEDPLESLRAEYDKLKGELELGNDNPSIIRQLKSLSVDMYSNRLISDSEFKNIIVRLI